MCKVYFGGEYVIKNAFKKNEFLKNGTQTPAKFVRKCRLIGNFGIFLVGPV